MPDIGTQLPNGDIYQAPKTPDQERPDTVGAAPERKPDPVQEAVERAKADPNRPNLQCPWCAQAQFADEDDFNQHVGQQHGHLFGEAANEARKAQDEAHLSATRAEKAQEQLDRLRAAAE